MVKSARNEFAMKSAGEISAGLLPSSMAPSMNSGCVAVAVEETLATIGTAASAWKIDGLPGCTPVSTGIGMQTLCQVCLTPGRHQLDISHGQLVLKASEETLLEAVMTDPDADLQPGSQWQRHFFRVPTPLIVAPLPSFSPTASGGEVLDAMMAEQAHQDDIDSIEELSARLLQEALVALVEQQGVPPKLGLEWPGTANLGKELVCAGVRCSLTLAAFGDLLEAFSRIRSISPKNGTLRNFQLIQGVSQLQG